MENTFLLQKHAPENQFFITLIVIKMFSFSPIIRGQKPIAMIMKNGRPADEDELIYLIPDDYRDRVKNSFNRVTLTLPEETMQLLPTLEEKQRTSCYIAGPSGTGKSTLCRDYIKMYHTLFPRNRVFIFSAIDDDEAYQDLRYIERIILDEQFLEEPLELGQFADCLIVYDDVDTIEKRDKNIFAKIKKIQNEILELGRHQNIDILVTSHLATNYHKTRALINECEKLCIMRPSSNPSGQQLIDRYTAFPRRMKEYIKSLTSRWVCVSNSYPQYIIHEKGIFSPTLKV